jgi:tetratricopeptide (TPR) repeat protein
MTLTLAKIESTLQQGNATDAQFLLQEWKNTQPETAESLYLQAVTALMLQQYSAAENFLIKALAKKPQQTNYFDTLGKIYAQQEKWQDAAAAFAQAIDNSKTANAEYFSSHATCLHFLEKHDSALAQITTALQLEPNNTQIKSIANLIILKTADRSSKNFVKNIHIQNFFISFSNIIFKPNALPIA